MQRLSDARYFAGWCVDVTEFQVIVSIDDVGDLLPKQEFQLELFGQKHNLTTRATCSVSLQNNFIFSVFKGPELTPASENARVSVGHYPCIFDWEGLTGEASVVDISFSGIGLVSSSQLERAAPISMVVTTPAGEIKANGTVKHCRKVKSNAQEFRIGVSLDFEDRISKARWNALFVKLLAA